MVLPVIEGFSAALVALAQHAYAEARLAFAAAGSAAAEAVRIESAAPLRGEEG